MKSIAVIGAGIFGLTSAFQLKQKGYQVDLYEESNRSGGVIQSVYKDGYLSELGPNTLLNTNIKLIDLIKALGLEPHLCPARDVGEARFLVRGGKMIQMPSKPLAFFSSSLFSWNAKFNLILEMFRPKWKNEYEETIAHFVRRRFGEEFLTYAIDALVAGIFAGDPERLSVPHGFPKLYRAEQKYGSLLRAQILGARERKRKGETSKQEARVLSFDRGLQTLTDSISAKLGDNLHCQAKLQKIRYQNSLWEICYSEKGELKKKEYDVVLVAIPAYELEKLEFEHPSGLSLKLFGEINYSPVASVILGYKEEDVRNTTKGFGMLIPGIEHFNILGTLFSSSLFEGRAPSGYITLSTYVGGLRQPNLARLPSEELTKMVHEDLCKLLYIQGNPVFKYTYYHERAIPQYEIGYGKFKDHIANLQHTCPGFYIGGNCVKGPALSDNIIFAHEMADNIAAYLEDTSVSAK